MTTIHVIPTAIRRVPLGQWLIGVSGGADSVALMRSVRLYRPDFEPIIVHLNHESRAEESDADSAFVATLAEREGVELISVRLSAVAPAVAPRIPCGTEAAYRDARHRLFARVAQERGAVGVLLAHHADDRAETVLLRLLRGGEPAALGGLRRDAVVATEFGDLRIHRPLLGVRRAELHRFLQSIDQPWREDASNASHDFARNRVRAFLHERPKLFEPLLGLADAADVLRSWTRDGTPVLSQTFPADFLGDLPDPLARAAARRWLLDRGCPVGEVSATSAELLVEMCRDRATAGRRNFPGEVQVFRKGRIITTLHTDLHTGHRQ